MKLTVFTCMLVFSSHFQILFYVLFSANSHFSSSYLSQKKFLNRNRNSLKRFAQEQGGGPNNYYMQIKEDKEWRKRQDYD